jgi:hypothetical protein
MMNESPHIEINTVTEISCMSKLLCSPGNKLLCSLLHLGILFTQMLMVITFTSEKHTGLGKIGQSGLEKRKGFQH